MSNGYLRARNIILDQLRDKMNIIPPPRQTIGCLIHSCASPLDDQAAIPAEDMFQLEFRVRSNHLGICGELSNEHQSRPRHPARSSSQSSQNPQGA